MVIFKYLAIFNATAEEAYRKPTEAPGAIYVGSSAVILVIVQAVFLLLMDLLNYKKSLRLVL